MGVEAKFQAMPEDCDLFITARQDRAIAEKIMFFNLYMVQTDKKWPNSPKWVEFYEKAKQVFQERPGLAERYFYAGGRKFDALVYLLSPVRRAGTGEKDDSLIYQAIYGQERLHPEAQAGQGGPIGFVPAAGVKIIAEYLQTITRNTLLEHFDIEAMSGHVYKVWKGNEEYLPDMFWDEFVGMRDVYVAAAAHNEAVIITID